MFGVLANCVFVIFGSLIGIVFHKYIGKESSDAVMTAMGLCCIYIGIDGALKGNNSLVLIVSLAVGTMVGTLIDLDKLINRLGDFIQKKMSLRKKNTNVAQGFVSASLLFCVGSMTIVGSLDAGIRGDNTILLTKSVIDCVAAMVLASSLGLGVMLSSAFILVFQGSIVLLARFLAPVLTDAVQAELICSGSLMIVAIGLNLIGVTKIKVANMMPALIVVPFLVPLFNMLPIG